MSHLSQQKANELLELRSMGIRTMFKERQNGVMYGNQSVKVPPPNQRAVGLEKKLGVDKEEHFLTNHQVLDQTMDLRNDVMNIVVSLPPGT